MSTKPEVPKLVLVVFVAQAFCNLEIQVSPSPFPTSSFLQTSAPRLPN